MTDLERKNYSVVRKAAAECIVLLKSDGSFPVANSEPISLYGAGARHTLRGGTGGGIVETRDFTTVEQGLINGGFKIVTNDWLDGYDEVVKKAQSDHTRQMQKAIATDGMTGLGTLSVPMKTPEYDLPFNGKSDVCLYVLTRSSGEGADRVADEGDVFLTNDEIRDVKTLAKKYKKFMLVLNVCGVVNLNPIVECVHNILLMSCLGSAGGDALCDVISGKVSPSGKLASTWASYGAYPHKGDWTAEDDTRYREGIYVGYRYFDSERVPTIFPFGYGLSYTNFVLTPETPSVSGSIVSVPATLKNIGKCDGKEVVQVYVSCPQGNIGRAYQELAGFIKSKSLKPGQSQKLTVEFDLRELRTFDDRQSARVLEAGDYVVRMGTSCKNTVPVAVIKLDYTVLVEKVKHVGSRPDFIDYKPTSKFRTPKDLTVINVKSTDIEPVTHTPVKLDKKAVEFVKSLSDDELCYLLTGHFLTEREGAELGDAAVPGAAGESTRALKSKGVDSLVMADGPAGLHIAGTFGVDEHGKYPCISEETKLIKSILPPDILKYLLVLFPDANNDDRHGEIFEQYCTAIPIETALAQSFNPEISYMCGDVVGSELDAFGVDVHLGPALNTHRHILCGRNFEYFSEDPLLAGKMAAGYIRGVQSHKGRSSCPKHFVCNEQDTNRLNSNSIVSERALRDIYMRPFEIAIKEGKPLVVMSSYNLLNGEHTSERKDLMEEVLRDEWGFDGFVVSDWVGYKKPPDGDKKYPRARGSKTVAAGNDLMMPGSLGHYEEIKNSLTDKTGVLTREQAEKDAARIISVIWKLKSQQVK